MFNATRPGGLDGWTMDLTQYELMRTHILAMAEEAFPTGRLTNYCTYTKVDLEARGVIERVARSRPQPLRRIPSPGSPRTPGLPG